MNKVTLTVARNRPFIRPKPCDFNASVGSLSSIVSVISFASQDEVALDTFASGPSSGSGRHV